MRRARARARHALHNPVQGPALAPRPQHLPVPRDELRLALGARARLGGRRRRGHERREARVVVREDAREGLEALHLGLPVHLRRCGGDVRRGGDTALLLAAAMGACV